MRTPSETQQRLLESGFYDLGCEHSAFLEFDHVYAAYAEGFCPACHKKFVSHDGNRRFCLCCRHTWFVDQTDHCKNYSWSPVSTAFIETSVSLQDDLLS